MNDGAKRIFFAFFLVIRAYTKIVLTLNERTVGMRKKKKTRSLVGVLNEEEYTYKLLLVFSYIYIYVYRVE